MSDQRHCSVSGVTNATALSQVKLQEKKQLLERQSEHLDACQRLIGVREQQLAEASKELEESRRANTDLRRSLEQMQESAEHDRWEGERR